MRTDGQPGCSSPRWPRARRNAQSPSKTQYKIQSRADQGNRDDTQLLEDYVWNEVLAGEDEDVVEVLLAVAVAKKVDPRLAQVLAGRPDAPELLALAEARGLFVSRVEQSEEFEIQSLVREVMDSVQSRRHLPGLPALHARAATWFEEDGQVESALDHWLEAGRPREALRLLAAQSGPLYDAGCEEIVVRTIAALPTARGGDRLPQHARVRLVQPGRGPAAVPGERRLRGRVGA